MTSALTIDDLMRGGKRALSDALARTEHSFDDPQLIALLDEAFLNSKAHVIGFTGPPGVGKSTLINGLIKAWRGQNKTVGVLAIDPSSQKSGGALLGDRTRMTTDPEDQGVFVRSLAARGQLGGLSELTFPALVLMRALFDVVVVETVGVGQSEADITSHADCVVLCVQPGSGDSLQFMKSGIMEIPDIAVVTKGDMGATASRTLSDLSGALSLSANADQLRAPQILMVSATRDEGLLELLEAIDSHFDWLIAKAYLQERRVQQAKKWLRARICRNFGEKGYELVEKRIDSTDSGPFQIQNEFADRLEISLKS